MLSSAQLEAALRIAGVVVPVAAYFLILGLLNSRRHPQLLSGRWDFALLIAALSPLFLLPALSWVGASPVGALAAAGALAGGAMLLAPKRRTWVVYNLPAAQARHVVERALASLGVTAEPDDAGLRLEGERAVVRIGGFPLLQNVLVKLQGGSEEFARRFEAALSRTLAGVNTEASPAAAAFLLVATAMLVAPLTLIAHRAPEIVRILTDLLN